jgi:hypothetical protein
MSQPLITSEISDEALRLKEMMDGILERVESVFQSYNVPLPSRRYWNIGQPPVDCAQVVVSFMGMYLGSPGDEIAQPQRCNVPRSATIAIHISREVAVVGVNGRPPSPEKIQQTSARSTIDSWVLMQTVREFDMWDGTGYGLGVVATLDASGPEGGFQTVTLNVTMAVP